MGKKIKFQNKGAVCSYLFLKLKILTASFAGQSEGST